MKRYLPGRVELAIFAAVALVCALFVSNLTAHDAGLSVLAFPVFIFAAVMGLWKHGRLRA